MRRTGYAGIITCLFLCGQHTFIFTQTYQRTYGGTGTDRGYSVIQAGDGNYVFAGSTTTAGAGGADVYLVKTNTAAVVLWSKAFGGAGNDIAYSMVQAGDGGYAIAGSTASFGAGGSDVYLLKTDSDGNLVWTATFGGAADDEGSSLTLTTDGGFAITGYTKSYGAGLKDVYLVKTNSDASAFWTSVIGSASDDEAYSIIQDTDGGYVMAGYTQGYGSAANDNAYVIKTDNAGTVSWTRVIGGGSPDELYDIVQNTDGSYLAVGGTKSNTCCGVGYEVYLVMMNNAGGIIWDKILGDDGSGSDEIATSLVLLSNGSYVITGYTKSFGAGLKDILLTRISFSGMTTTVHWQYAIGGTSNDEGKSLAVTSDGGFAFAGITTSFGAGGEEVYFVRSNSGGISGCNTQATGLFFGNPFPASGITTGSASASGGSSVSGGTSSGAATKIAYNACTNSVLPVDMLRFWAIQEGNTVHLLWSTASERNSDRFTVERSTDNNYWNAIGSIPAAGNSSAQENYDFIDFDPPIVVANETFFYRLRQTDHNGSADYFGPVAVRPLAEEGISLFPNPTDGKFMMTIQDSFAKKEGNILVLVRDIFGQEYYSKVIFKDRNEQSIAVDPENKIPAGVYTVVASSDDHIYMKTIVIY